MKQQQEKYQKIIFSRSACNFAFPAEYPRPLPDKSDGKAVSENELNGLTQNMLRNMDDYIGDSTETNDEEINIAHLHLALILKFTMMHFNYRF